MKDLIFDGKLVIGIDHGYGNMKTRNEVFKSGVKAYSEEPAIATNVLQLDGMYYVIGESHKVFIANKDEDKSAGLRLRRWELFVMIIRFLNIKRQ